MKSSEAHVVEDGDYQHLLVLGAIAAASAFVVTILIVLFCICCQRKSKSKTPLSGEKGTSINMDSKSYGAINSRDSVNGLPGVKGSPLSSLNSTCTQNSNTSECSSVLKIRKIANTYSIIIRARKKRPPIETRGSQTLPRSFGRNKSSQFQTVQDQACPQKEPSPEPIGSCTWVAYATLKRPRQDKVEKTNNSTAPEDVITLNKKKQQQQQRGAPAETQESEPNALHFTGLHRVENFCETVGDVKPGSDSTCNTTIFTFNDGMEMYVTGL